MLQKILGYLKSVLAPVAILIILAALVLVMGSRVGLTFKWRLIIAGILVLVAVVTYLVVLWIRRRREKQFEAGILQQAREDVDRASVARRAEIENLVGRWRESIRLLRESGLKGKNVLNRLPWFAIIGEPQCGKSTLLRNSGLDFPIGDAAIEGIGGTKNCDWWFANEGIILDTAGRYAFEVQNAPDRAEWERFLNLLRKTRKQKAINGLMVTVPTDTLLQRGEEDVRAYAQRLRSKINDLMTRLETIFPVYLIVTKVDLVEGFVDFFSRYPADRVREAVGRTFTDVRPAQGLQDSTKTLDDLYDRLCSMSLGLMEEEDPGDPAQPHLMFPEEYRTLAGKLKTLIEALFRENIYMRNPIFRGVYLTSGTQEGRTIATAFTQMAANLKMNPEVMTSLHEVEKAKRAYFVRDLLSRILIDDSKRDLVRPLELGPRAQMFRALGRVVIPAVLIGGLVLTWAFVSYGASRDSWRGLNEHLAETRILETRERAATPGGADIAKAIDDLGRLNDLHESATGRSALLNLFLKRGEPAAIAYNQRFRDAFEKNLLEPVLARVFSILEGRPGAPTVSNAQYLGLLRAYLALERARVEPEHGEWDKTVGLLDPWTLERDRYEIDEKKDAFRRLITFYARLGRGELERPIDWTLVAARLRAFVSREQAEDPMNRLREWSGENAATLRAGRDATALREAWDTLVDIVGAGVGAAAISETDLEQMVQDLTAIGGPKETLQALQVLRGGRSDVAAEEVADPAQRSLLALRAAMEKSPPESCPEVDAGDPAKVDEAVTQISQFDSEMESLAVEVRQAIQAFNGEHPSARPIEGDLVADFIRSTKVSEYTVSCADVWFASGGGLSAGALADAVGGGGGGEAEYVHPAGDAFECLVKITEGAGDYDRQALGELDAAVDRLWKVEGISTAAESALKRDWGGNKASLGGGGNWSAAVRYIGLAKNPESWNTLNVVLDDLEEIATDGSLDAIVGKIEPEARGSARTDLRGFEHEEYLANVTKIQEALAAAMDKDLGLARMAAEFYSTGVTRNPFVLAAKEARKAPDTRTNLASKLEAVPNTVWRLLLREAKAELNEFYGDKILGPMQTLSRCFPFNEKGSDCPAAPFNEVFGPEGSVALLVDACEPFVSGESRSGLDGLDFGSGFRSFLTSASAIQKAFGQGGASGFRIEMVPKDPEISPAGKTKDGQIGFGVESYWVVLGEGEEHALYEGGRRSRTTATVPVSSDATARLEFKLEDVSKKSFGQKINPFGKDLFTMDKVDFTPLEEKKGPFSFLRFMRSDKKPGDRSCCRFEVPVFKKEKRGRGDQIATIEFEFDVTSSQILDTKTWSLKYLPARVSE